MKSPYREQILIQWFLWHFYEAPAFLFLVWENVIVATLHFFSIPDLLKTLFSPWKRYQWVYPKGFNPAEFINILISNLFSRLIGAISRFVLILIGLIVQVLVVVLGGVVILLWFLLPIAIVLLILFLMYGF